LATPKYSDYVAFITDFAYSNPKNQGVGVKISYKAHDRNSYRVESDRGNIFVATAADYVALMKPRVM